MLVQLAGPEWPGVKIAIEQDDGIRWLEFILDDQIIGNTGQDLGAECKSQDDQGQEQRACSKNVPQGMLLDE